MEIKWEYTGPDREHYVFGNLVFKKKKGAAGETFYQIYRAEEVIYSNVGYQKFMQLASNYLDWERKRIENL